MTPARAATSWCSMRTWPWASRCVTTEAQSLGDVVGGAEAVELEVDGAEPSANGGVRGRALRACWSRRGGVEHGVDDAASRRRWQGGCVWGGLALPAPRGLHLQAVESCPQHMKKGRFFSGPVDGG